jgi:DNA modification methylase
MINELKLDLACGDNKREGYIGIDIADTESVDHVVDLQVFPWPIESESAEEINCGHYIEHIKHDNVALDLKEALNKSNSFEEFKENINSEGFLNPQDGFIKFINEVYRILKPGGKVYMVTPYYTSARAFGDPTHVRYIADSSFWYLSKEWMDINNLTHYGLKCDFDVKLSYHISNEMTLKSEEVRNRAFLHDWNTVDDLIIELTKK